jgi:hypothetical protein
MSGIDSLVPNSDEDADWHLECDRLFDLIKAGEEKAALDWFLVHYPRCMALVPKRRRDIFIRGVFEEALDRSY